MFAPEFCVDHRLQIVRQAVVLRLVHAVEEHRGAEPGAVLELHVVVDQLVDLERQRDLVGDRGAVDHVLGQRLGQLRHRHADRAGAERLEHEAAGARRRADLEAGEVRGLAHRLIDGVQRVAGVDVDQDRLHVLVLLGQPLVVEVLDREVGRDRVAAVHERQLEHLGARELAGRVAGHGPDDVDHAVAQLADQLRRAAAQGHRG